MCRSPVGLHDLWKNLIWNRSPKTEPPLYIRLFLQSTESRPFRNYPGKVWEMSQRSNWHLKTIAEYWFIATTVGDSAVTICSQPASGECLLIPRGAVEMHPKQSRNNVCRSIQHIDSASSERGDNTIGTLITNCNTKCQTDVRSKPLTQSPAITLPKKSNIQQWPNYRTTIIVVHPSEVNLKTNVNRLRSQAEMIIAEREAGFKNTITKKNIQASEKWRTSRINKNMSPLNSRKPIEYGW